MAKKKDTISNVALGGIISTTVIGATSQATGVGSSISSSYATGVGKVGSKIPVVAKMKGTRMVLNQVRNLKPKKLMKGGKSI